MSACWCGGSELISFNVEYARCGDCGTLVSLQGLSSDALLVKDDETDFYGKQYWLKHQSEELQYPDIYQRARLDLTERNLHWLKTLMRYIAPPAKVLEIGCAHGSFVALMRHVGYDATGIELSAWVAEFGKNSFDIPVLTGLIEDHPIPNELYDVIVMIDVLEHLPDPVKTMSHCMKLLKPNGFLMIQTPEFQENMQHTSLIEIKSRFLEQLKFDEHLYLFSKKSVESLFNRLGASNIQFEPAIFHYYDMFFMVSRQPMAPLSAEDSQKRLLTSLSGRMVLALLDMREREQVWLQHLEKSEALSKARLDVIETFRLDGLLFRVARHVLRVLRP
ncbi:MAG: class I SAM-dependent methyltransferase [Gammaproteobacteria bacterium]|nr:class I SAM-dependent methyltransferase [Gammaproteobacteria bacterium]